jgi:hypothetical protein
MNPLPVARSAVLNILFLIIAIFSLVALAAPLRASIDASTQVRPLPRKTGP